MRFCLLVIYLSITGLSSAQDRKVLDLKTSWRFTIGDDPAYADLDYDDSNWEEIWVPDSWEVQGFANYNGYAWYRFSFDGTDLQGIEGLMINLGYIDDVHEAYFNGELVGFKGSFPPTYYTAFDVLNQYKIPEELINRNSKNTIAVKVYDLTVYGGIVKGDIGIFVDRSYDKDFFSLEGIWKFSIGDGQDWEKESFDDSDWENIVVPSFWRSKHIKHSEVSFAWYRKEFRVPKALRNQDIYLVLGQIDDFDVTYINGTEVGHTKDWRPMGMSGSWLEFRTYKIPMELLNQRGKNVIAVQVEDIGGDAGIYNGPIGLVSKNVREIRIKEE